MEREAEIARELKRDQPPRTSIQHEDDDGDVSRVNETADYKMTQSFITF